MLRHAVGSRGRAAQWLIAAGWTIASIAQAAPSTVRILAQDAQGVTLEARYAAPAFDTLRIAGTAYARWTPADGVMLTGAAGSPAMPVMSALVGVPPGAHPKVQIVSVESEPFAALPPAPAAQAGALDHEMLVEARVPDPAAYAAGAMAPREGWVRLGEPQMVRDLQVATVVFQPLRVEAATGRGTRASRLVVRLTYGASAAATTSLAGGLGRDRLADLYAVVLNAQAASAWVTPPVTAARFELHSTTASSPAWKLRIRAAGVRRVSFATLAAQGFPSGRPLSELALEMRGFDDATLGATTTPVAIEVHDVNANGVFDAGDDFVFIASDLVERYGVKDGRVNFGNENVYWLTLAGNGARIATADGWPSLPEPSVPTTFTDSLRLERDGSMLPFWASNENGDVRDQYVWFNSDIQCSAELPPSGVDTTFTVGPHPASGTARFRAVFRSNAGSFLASQKTHDITMRLQNVGSPLADTLHVPTRAFSNFWPTDTMLAVADVPLDKFPGARWSMHFTGTFSESGSPAQDFTFGVIDYAELLYPRFYQSDTHALTFRDGGVRGNAEFHVSGFADTALVVYDVTTPAAAQRLSLAQRSEQLVSGSGGVEVRVRAVVNTPRRYLATRRADIAEIAALDVVRDSVANLASPSTAADYVVITPDSFRTVLAPLLDLRRAEGLRVQVATLEDVLDEFNGGVRSDLAIRRYLAVQLPAYALLVGDGSQDHKTASPSSPPDIMPTHLIYSSGELIGADGWFACVDNLRHPSMVQRDIVPDLAIGRLPAGSLAECQTLVDKIVTYETRTGDAPWRERFGLMADDQYSTNYFSGSSTGNDYGYNGWEGQFVQAHEVSINQLRASGLTRVQPVRYYLADSTSAERQRYLDRGLQPPTLPQMVGYVTGRSDIRSGKGWNPYFYGQLSDSSTGCNVIYYQGHGNRWQAAHERMIWEYNDQPGCIDGSYSRHNLQCNLQNFGRPVVLFLFGCHLSEFERKEELNSCIEDALGEKAVLVPGAGAVATFGSTAFEYAGPNVDLESAINQSFWQVLPAVSAGEPHVVLGRTIAAGLVRYGAPLQAIGDYANGEATLRYVLLGDPATRLAAAPPTLRVQLNGQPVISGQRLRSTTASGVLTATLEDENGIEAARIEVRETDTGASLPVTLVPRDSLPGGVVGDRRWSLSAPVTLHIGDYDIVVRATDRAGRVSEVRLTVDSQVDMTVNGRPFRSQGSGSERRYIDRFVPADAEVRFRIVPPTTIVADSIQILLDGAVQTRALASEGDSVWTATVQFAAAPIAAGTHSLELRFTGLSYAVPIEVAHGLAVQQVYAYPNPFAARTGVQYQLTQKATRAQVRVYSLAGRLVRELDAPAETGLNVVQWDGTDADGDQAANGVYLLVLRAWDAQGHIQEGQTRLARTR